MPTTNESVLPPQAAVSIKEKNSLVVQACRDLEKNTHEEGKTVDIYDKFTVKRKRAIAAVVSLAALLARKCRPSLHCSG